MTVRAIAKTKEEFLRILAEAYKTADCDIDFVIIATVSALETGWGKRVIDNNLFNIKSNKGVSVLTTEYENQQMKKVYQNFKVYQSLSESIKDFCSLVKRRYSFAYANRSCPARFFEGLVAGGYATDIRYLDKLLQVYEVIRKELKE